MSQEILNLASQTSFPFSSLSSELSNGVENQIPIIYVIGGIKSSSSSLPPPIAPSVSRIHFSFVFSTTTQASMIGSITSQPVGNTHSNNQASATRTILVPLALY